MSGFRRKDIETTGDSAAVNIKNHIAYIPEAFDILRAEIERVVGTDAVRGTHLRLAA